MTNNIFAIIFHFFQGSGIYGSFLSMFIENIGIPLPTEIGYLIGQNLISQGLYSYPVVLIVLTLGHVLGSVVSYWIGRWGDSYVTRRLKSNKKIHEIHKKLENWYKKYGNWTVFLTRFVGYVRPWSSFVAGFAEVEFWPFLLWTTIGSIIFNVINLYFSQIFILIWRKYAVYHVLIIVVAAAFFLGFIIYEVVKYLLSLRNTKDE